jgi:hypothetical protein
MVVHMYIVVSCNVAPYGLVAHYQHVIETCCFCLQNTGHYDTLRRCPMSYLLFAGMLKLCRQNYVCKFSIRNQIKFSESVQVC